MSCTTCRVWAKNLQDHYGALVTLQEPPAVTVNDIMMNPLKQLQVGLQYILFRTGPLTISAAQVGAFAKSDPRLATPDIQFLFQTFSHDENDDGFTSSRALPMRFARFVPESRGTLAPAFGTGVRHTADAAELPRVRDRQARPGGGDQAVAQGGRKGCDPAHIIAEYARAPRFSRTTKSLPMQGRPASRSPIKVGTCKMGSDPMAVVDTELKVHGIQRLCG